jgi:chromosome segregation ATPase
MRAALAYQPEHDEVPVSSTEVLEANVVSIRDELKELKSDFKEHRKEFHAAIARLDNGIRSAVSELRAEIRSMAVKAENDLKEFSARVENQLCEMRAEMRDMRGDLQEMRTEIRDSRGDLQEVRTEIRESRAELRDLHADHLSLRGTVEKNHEQLIATDKKVTEIGTKLNALLWLVGGLSAVVTFFITVGKAVGWF